MASRTSGTKEANTAGDAGKPKAYGLFAATVNDPDAYYNKYLPAAAQTLKPYGARPIAFGKDHIPLEGPAFTINIMMLEYPDIDVFHTWYHSEAYAPVKDIRMAATTVNMSIAKVGEPSTANLSAATNPHAEKPKAFVWLNDTVTDQSAYDDYAKKADPVFAQYGGRVVVKGHNNELLEGTVTPDNLTIIEFSDKDQLLKWHNSPEYQALIPQHVAASTIVFMIGHEAIPAPK